MKANCHIHLPPNYSAFSSIEDAVSRASAERIDILGISNYYSFENYSNFGKECRDQGISPIFGVEIICWDDESAERGALINDPGNPGKMYLCGKGITEFENPSPRATSILNTICRNDEERINTMIEMLNELFVRSGVSMEEDSQSIANRVEYRSLNQRLMLQERHVARGMQEALFERVPLDKRRESLSDILGKEITHLANNAVVVQNEIRTHLMKSGKPAFVPETFISFAMATELIRELGGRIVYPIVADGMFPISEFEQTPRDLVFNLRKRKIDAVEFIPPRNSVSGLVKYAEELKKSGFILSAGTEHNTQEMIPLKPHCRGGQEIPFEAEVWFLEGAESYLSWQHKTVERMESIHAKH